MRALFEPEHEAFRESFARFVAKELVPDYLQWEADGIVPREVYRRAGEFGFLGMAIPEQYGGGGVDDFRFNQVLAEEGAAAGVTGAIAGITLHNDVCLPYFTEYCTPEQAERWMPGIASGELITAIAMTEPGTGSDLAGIATTAIRDGDEFVVNGSKTFITNGINADLVVVVAKTDPSQRHTGMSLLVVERDMPGFERGRNLDKVGLHSQDTAELFFNDVRVPVANLLGQEARRSPISATTSPRSGSRSPCTAWRWRALRSGGRSTTCRSGRRSAPRSVPSRTRSSCWPSARPRSSSPRRSSTSASGRMLPNSSLAPPGIEGTVCGVHDQLVKNRRRSPVVARDAITRTEIGRFSTMGSMPA